MTRTVDLDRFSGQFACAFGISKIRGYEIRLAAGRADFYDSPFAAFHIATHDDDVDSEGGELIGYRTSDAAGATVINAVDEFIFIYEPFVRLKWLHREEAVETLSFQLHVIFGLM